jgi:carboxylesterase
MGGSMISWGMWIVLAVVAVWIAGDLCYSLLMKRGYARWNRGIEREPDGVRRDCREYTIGTGDTALLFVHGFGDSPSIFQRMAPALANHGFTCRVMRLPGFAMPMAAYRKTSGAAWRQAVSSELHALRQNHSRVVVVGHSLGAAVAVDCLADQPDAADAVVLLAPLINVCNRRSPVLPARAWYHILDSLLLFTDRIGMVLPPDLRDADARSLMKQDQHIPRIVYREMFALIRRNRGRAATFRAPLLLALAKDDLVVDNRAAEAFFNRCPAVPKRLVVLEEAGHILPLDRGWEKVVEEIRTFLDAAVAPDR